MSSSPNKSLWSLLVAQTQVAFNDHAVKFMLIGLAQMILSEHASTGLTSLLGILLVTPVVLFAPTAGWLADRFSKREVLQWGLVAQVMVMLFLLLAVYIKSLPLAVVGFSLMAVQACAFSPAKQGILKELVGSEHLGTAVGWMEMTGIVAILLGSGCGAWCFDQFTKHFSNPWTASQATLGIFTLGALVAWLVFQGVQKTSAQSTQAFTPSICWSHFMEVKALWKEKSLRLAALGLAYFYSFGGIIYMTLIQLGRDLHHGQVGAASSSAGFLLSLGLGVALGSVTAGLISRRHIELGLVPVGALGWLVAIVVLSLISPSHIMFRAVLGVFGFFAGMFTVPLNAYLQDKAGNEKRARVIAATNLLLNLGGILAIGIYWMLSEVLHLGVTGQLMVLIAPSVAVALYVLWLLPESLLRLSIVLVGRCLYRVRAQGLENLPKGGALLVCNHVTYVDAIVLQIACPRPIRFVAYEGLHKKFGLGWIVRMLGVIPISPRHAKEAVRTVAKELTEGHLVCIFPEGQLTRTGVLLGLRKGFELMARQGGVPVVPIFMDALWGSIFSFSENRFFRKLPRKLPYPVFVNFGKPISATDVTTPKTWQSLLDLGADAFQNRPELAGHLGYAAVQSLSRQPWKPLVVDRQLEKPMKFSRGTTLALSVALAQRWKKSIQGKRVGVVLPPGIGAVVANLALALIGKVPVNLNFTAGRTALESSMRQAGIETIISAQALQKRLPDFPWPQNVMDMQDEMKSLSRSEAAFWFLATWLIPSAVMARWLGIPRHGDRDEAILFFTSGSSGDPKGVSLTHRNILGNISQIAASGIMQHGDVMLGCLPLFHCFGYTVTLWYPMLQGVSLVTLPSPLEARKVGEAVFAEKATILPGAPTFLRGYVRKVEAEKFCSLRMVIAGAEKLPPELNAEFQQKFGIPIYEGYGLTETTPVSAVNRPDPGLPTSTAEPQAGRRLGSVGRLVPGMTARIMDIETSEELPVTKTGMLYLKGCNVFEGYLGDSSRTQEVLRDGWFCTGDLARFDEDGFLYIEGRLSRFSKIGGEMVPHGTVEQKVMEVLGVQQAEVQPVVVVGVPDPAKGEALVMITTLELTTAGLREKLIANGVPNLWIPRDIRRVEKIPLLGTGKLDLKKCKELVNS